FGSFVTGRVLRRRSRHHGPYRDRQGSRATRRPDEGDSTMNATPSASQIAQDYPASVIRKVFERVAGFDDVASLTVGEPDFDTPAHVVEAAVESMRAGDTRYTPNAGIPQLRDVLARMYTQQWGREIGRADVMVTVGGQE